MNYIGIDPGQSGGIAVISDSPSGYVRGSAFAVKMPDTEADLWAYLQPYGLVQSGSKQSSQAVLERVWSSPGWGHVGAFKFGLSYGSLRMALTAAGIPFDEVLPAKWQTVMGCRSAGDKNITKRRAQSLFPDRKVTHAIADALLIAEFCRRLRGRYGEAKDGDEAISEKDSRFAQRLADERDRETRHAEKEGAALASPARRGIRADAQRPTR